MAELSGATDVRVRYEETDRGGVVYHSNYLIYFEIGRTELMRALGVPYRGIEEAGTTLAVVDAQVRFHRPARYDDRLRIETTLAAAAGARVRFDYLIRDAEAGEVLCTGSTVLASLDPATGRPCRLPPPLRELTADLPPIR